MLLEIKASFPLVALGCRVIVICPFIGKTIKNKKEIMGYILNINWILLLIFPNIQS
jgi:hypothetical protein